MSPVRSSRHQPSEGQGSSRDLRGSERESQASWEQRWGRLSRALDIASDEGLLVALSGGADSVFLLHLLAAARPRVRLHAVHVNHGLRGDESDADARFCAALCRELDVPFTARDVRLVPEGPSLEARAREARYGVLVEEAERTGHRTILTGHHSDDALESVLMRWVRGSSLAGLRGPRRRWNPSPAHPDVRVVRPLLAMRREEVRTLLERRGLDWREDGSNNDPRFTRNRMRHGFLPLLERIGGREGIENLRAFGEAVENLEGQFARATAHLNWECAPYARSGRAAAARPLGGVLPRGALMELSPPLRRRALWRLLLEGTGRPPTDHHLGFCLETLANARTTRMNLRGGWQLVFRAAQLHLLAPPARLEPAPLEEPLDLPVPGQLTLADGRRFSAEILAPAPNTPVPRDGHTIELDAAGLPPGPLQLRLPRPGDRFHPLGSPGTRPLRRYLADRGIPREERKEIPLVYAADELVWVCGHAPCEPRRIHSGTRLRLRLALSD